MIATTKFRSDDRFKSCGSMKYLLSSQMGAAILCMYIYFQTKLCFNSFGIILSMLYFHVY